MEKHKRRNDFTIELEMKLIDIVAKHQHLFDRSDRFYRDVDLRERTWKEIAKKLGVKTDSAKHKFRYLRDQYNRHLRSNLNIGRKLADRTFVHYESMHFLKYSYRPHGVVELPWDKDLRIVKRKNTKCDTEKPTRLVPHELEFQQENTTCDATLHARKDRSNDSEKEYEEEENSQFSYRMTPSPQNIQQVPSAHYSVGQHRKVPVKVDTSQFDEQMGHYFKAVECHLRTANFTAVELLSLESRVLDLIRIYLERQQNRE